MLTTNNTVRWMYVALVAAIPYMVDAEGTPQWNQQGRVAFPEPYQHQQGTPQQPYQRSPGGQPFNYQPGMPPPRYSLDTYKPTWKIGDPMPEPKPLVGPTFPEPTRPRYTGGNTVQAKGPPPHYPLGVYKSQWQPGYPMPMPGLPVEPAFPEPEIPSRQAPKVATKTPINGIRREALPPVIKWKHTVKLSLMKMWMPLQTLIPAMQVLPMVHGYCTDVAGVRDNLFLLIKKIEQSYLGLFGKLSKLKSNMIFFAKHTLHPTASTIQRVDMIAEGPTRSVACVVVKPSDNLPAAEYGWFTGPSKSKQETIRTLFRDIMKASTELYRVPLSPVVKAYLLTGGAVYVPPMPMVASVPAAMQMPGPPRQATI